MTAEPPPSVLFRKSIERGAALNALSAAADLKPLRLPDALALVYVCRQAPEYEKLASRFHARLVTELGVRSLAAANLILSGLLLLPDHHDEGVSTLRAIFRRYGRDDLLKELERITQPPGPLAPK